MEYLLKVHHFLVGAFQLQEHEPSNSRTFSSFFTTLHVAEMPFFDQDTAFYIAAVAIPLYLLFVFVGPIVMKNREPIRLDFIFKIWNLFLTILSLFMLISMGYPTLYHIFQGKFFLFMCLPVELKYYPWHGIHVLGIWLFGLSKVIEFGDTVFLVLRKKPVSLLHWYHHTSVLAFTSFSIVVRSPQGWVFAIVNSFVHSIMYFYYFLTGIGIRPWWAIYITQLQILQMIIGVCVAIVWCYLCSTSFHCNITEGSNTQILIAGVLIYGSYLALFAQYYFSRWEEKPQSKRGDGKKSVRKTD